MKIGDKFYSNINGGIEVTIIDIIYGQEDITSQYTILLCVGDGLLLKYLETTKYYFDEVIVEEPEYLGCVDTLKNISKYDI